MQVVLTPISTKVARTIVGCRTAGQLATAFRMLLNYVELYGTDYHILRLYKRTKQRIHISQVSNEVNQTKP